MKILALTLLTLLPALILAGMVRSVWGKMEVSQSVNPCCCVVGRQSYFKIDVEPRDAFPDSSIRWEADNPGELATTNLYGRVVAVTPTEIGENGLTVKIRGFPGPDPYIRYFSVTETVTPVYAWIVGNNNGSHYSRTPSEIHSMFTNVNHIFRQVGMRFEVRNIAYTNSTEFLVVKRRNGLLVPAEEICNIATNTGGLEFYFVDEIDNGYISAFNCRRNSFPQGIIASTNATSTTLAHEIGHSCGLKDIYASYRNVPQQVTGMVSRNRLPEDWGTMAEIGYYPAMFKQSALIKNLLMYGIGSDTKRDISRGDIEGLCYVESAGVKTWFVENATVGFLIYGNSTPVHY